MSALFATYSETIRLAVVVVVLFVTAGIALWMRDYRRSGSAARPVTLSEEARSAFRHAKEASLQEAREAKKIARDAHRRSRQTR